MISKPAGVVDALKRGVKPYKLFKLTLGSTVYRFARAPKDLTWDSQTWDTDTPLLKVRNVGSANQNGTLDLILKDAARTWHRRFLAAGAAGKAVEVVDLLPYGSGRFSVVSAFTGRTLRAATIRPTNDDEDYGLAVECADAAAVPLGERTQWATDAFQQELVAETAGVDADDSHSESNKARELVWHRT